MGSDGAMAQVDKDHPFARFDVGTFETLHGDAPRQTREELLRWSQQHYTADRMKVVIVTRNCQELLQIRNTQCVNSVLTL